MEFESPAFRMIEIDIGTAKDEETSIFYDDIDDIEYFKRKLSSALQVPKEYLEINYDEEVRKIDCRVLGGRN